MSSDRPTVQEAGVTFASAATAHLFSVDETEQDAHRLNVEKSSEDRSSKTLIAALIPEGCYFTGF